MTEQIHAVVGSHPPGPAEPPSAAGRLLAWVDRRRSWVLAAVLLLYAAGFTGKWRVSPDSALYMSLGRSLAEGGGFTYHGEKHTWFEPGLPGVIAASFGLFGEDNYLPILAFILLCSLVALWLTYRLMLRHAGRPTAVLVTALFAACETCLRYGFQVVTDTPFLVAVLLFLLGYERLVGGADKAAGGHEPAAGAGPPGSAGPPGGGGGGGRRWVGWPMLAAAVVIMVVFRPTSVTFVGAVGLATARHVLRGPRRLRHALIGLLTLACFLGFRAVDPRRAGLDQPVEREQRLRDLLTTNRSFALNRIATVTVPDFVEEILPEAVIGTELGPGINTAFSLAVMAAGLALARRRVLWGAWAGATFFQCMFWLPRERYLLPVLPLLIYGLWRGATWLTSRPRLSPRAASILLGAMLALYLGPNLARDAAFLIEQRRVGIHGSGEGDREFAPYLEMARRIGAVVGERDLVFATEHRQLSYFSRRRVEASPWSYRWPPTPRQERRFNENLEAADALYVVLPDTSREPHVTRLIERLGVRPGPALTSIERRDGKGRPLPPLTLHRLEAGVTGAAVDAVPDRVARATGP